MNDKLQELIEKVLNSKTLVEAKRHVKEIQDSMNEAEEVPAPEETEEDDYDSSYESSYDDDYDSSY